jgi:hypothetical protein
MYIKSSYTGKITSAKQSTLSGKKAMHVAGGLIRGIETKPNK